MGNLIVTSGSWTIDVSTGWNCRTIRAGGDDNVLCFNFLANNRMHNRSIHTQDKNMHFMQRSRSKFLTPNKSWRLDRHKLPNFIFPSFQTRRRAHI